MSSSQNDDSVAIEQAILQTILYSDLFDYALTPDEIARYLIGIRIDAGTIRARLAAPVWLDGQIVRADGHITARGRASLASRRPQRRASSLRLWRRARQFVHILACIPFVRMVAVTGALAMDNSAAGDDIDVMIVTAPGRVWLTRALCVLLVYAGKLARQTLCPNYFISENALALQERTLFVAHEFVQMIPLYGANVYTRMQAANPWVERLLPNASQAPRQEREHRPGRLIESWKRLAEWLLSGSIGNRLEAWEMRRKMDKFQPLLDQPGTAAVLDRDHVKGHFDDYGGPVLQRYERRLADFGLRAPSMEDGPARSSQAAPSSEPRATRSARYAFQE